MFSTIAVLAINHVLARLPGWLERRVLFWGVQLLNLGMGAWMFGLGIPDLRNTADIANKMLGLLFFFHIVTNNMRLQRHRKQSNQQRTDNEQQQRERIRAALHAAETSSPTVEAPPEAP